MVTYSNSPIRCRFTADEVWNMILPKGIDAAYYPVPETNEKEFYCKLVASDLNPHNPQEEKYKEDLENVLNKLPIIQDHIREFKPYSFFNTKKNRIIETILDEKVFSKENRYDILIDKFQKSIHLLPNSNGKRFITVEDS